MGGEAAEEDVRGDAAAVLDVPPSGMQASGGIGADVTDTLGRNGGMRECRQREGHKQHEGKNKRREFFH